MQDRPSVDELLAALEIYLDDLTASLEGSRSFHTRVAANTVRIVRRELQNEDEALAAEWEGLDALLGTEPRPDTRAESRQRLIERNKELCSQIQSGTLPATPELIQHLRGTVRNKLRASDPKLLERSGE